MREKTFSLEDKFDFFLQDAMHPFSGWDFSHIRDRMVTEPLTWSYSSEILPFVRSVETCLDMGTGGGEFLASLQPLPKKTFATEAFKPNVPIAKEKLEALNVKVIELQEGSTLPFENNFFDLIINRHESYIPTEIFRVLKPGGFFITQQVGARNDIELNYIFEEDFTEEKFEYNYWTLQYAKKELEEAEFKIIKSKEFFPKTRIFDIGAVIYYLKAIPWQITNFTVENHLQKLKELHKKIEKEGYLELTSHYFLLKTQKTKKKSKYLAGI